MAKKLTKAEQLARRSHVEFSRIPNDEEGLKELRDYLKIFRSGYSRRVAAINRRGIYSYAQDALENSMPKEMMSVKLTELNRNQLLFQIAAYQKFFNDVTSTIQGIKKVNREQDARIFGTYKNGLPRKRMTEEQRKEFWRLYDEFRNQFPKWSTQPYSETTQQYIAKVMFNQEDFSLIDFTERLEILNLLLTEENEIIIPEDIPDVYTGAGPTFTEKFSSPAIRTPRKRKKANNKG